MQHYIVEKGDTLWLIAKRFGVSLEELIRANPQIKDPNKIYPGNRINIPLPSEAVCPFIRCAPAIRCG